MGAPAPESVTLFLVMTEGNDIAQLQPDSMAHHKSSDKNRDSHDSNDVAHAPMWSVTVTPSKQAFKPGWQLSDNYRIIRSRPSSIYEQRKVILRQFYESPG